MIFRPGFYALTYLLTALAGVFLVVLMIQLTGVNLSSAAVQFLPVMFAAILEGQRYAKTGAAEPGSAAMWRAAIAMTGMATGLLLLWSWLQLMQVGQMVNTAILMRLGLMVLVYLVANRWFYQIGFRAAARERR